MREENQLKIICSIIEQYKLNEPLSGHLKDFFKAHPQMGSRDRRLASAFTYNYFRIGKALTDVRLIERLTIANFLCSTVSNPLLAYCLEKFSLLKEEDIQHSPEEKISKITNQYQQFKLEKLFPFSSHLSDRIDKKKFIESFLEQPKLWIRIRKGFQQKVFDEFSEKNISFEANENNPLSVSLVNATSLEKTDSFINGYFEIQDWSSQQTIKYIQPQPKQSWWDACAGSGGKSLMMFDTEPTISVFATDSRSSILKNLEERFSKTGMKNFKTMQADLTDTKLQFSNFNFQYPSAVLTDVPCTGSGTWARTPEWLTMFNENEIARYVSLQRSIIQNITGGMKMRTPLVYITCSVFKEENEMNVEWIKANAKLSLVQSGYVEGTDKGADTLFAARFVKE